MCPEPLTYAMHAQTDPGRVRRNNEDALAFDATLGLCVLADGMGGANAGELASSMAVAVLQSTLTLWLSRGGLQAGAEALRQAMRDAVAQANRDVLRESRAHAEHAGMGTTLVLAVFAGDSLQLGHIGDSRCYRWRRGALVQLTKDHSYVQAQVDAGRLTPAQAERSAKRHLVTRALGVTPQVELELHAHRVEAGDVYLMCSDGLSDMVSDAELAGILASAEPLARQVGRLVDAANARGGGDNITVLLARADRVDAKSSGGMRHD
jgi:protein phosphatase